MLPNGLSPRVRGNQVVLPLDVDGDGSIPACAGEPGPYSPLSSRITVYPRVCGGTFNVRIRVRTVCGLSPRVRGNQVDEHELVARQGSIPACAGEPNSRTSSATGPRVYPRVCGGTIIADRAKLTGTGLSPRVRGNQNRRGQRRHGSGSIPACAGEPVLTSLGHWEGPVYPRVCGGTVLAKAWSEEG